MTTTTEFLVIRNVAVVRRFEEDRGESESADRAATAGVTTRSVAPKKGTRYHHEIVCPTREAAVALASYVGGRNEHMIGMLRDGSFGDDWSEVREAIAIQRSFARAYEILHEFDRAEVAR